MRKIGAYKEKFVNCERLNINSSVLFLNICHRCNESLYVFERLNINSSVLFLNICHWCNESLYVLSTLSLIMTNKLYRKSLALIRKKSIFDD